jgi:poly-gamma-glutamate synthesis protein (capsule biosynthesis protein)
MTAKPKFVKLYNSWGHVLILLFVTAASPAEAYAASMPKSQTITLFMAGDVMTGRGIDQVLPYPGDPRLHESYVKNAGRYVALAEAANGSI